MARSILLPRPLSAPSRGRDSSMLRPSLFVVALLAALAGSAQADCPQACITLGANAPICSSAPSYSRWQNGECYDLARFDVPNAQLFAEALTNGFGCSTD